MNLPTPLSVELEEKFDLDYELRKCRAEILRLVEYYEQLREREAATQQNIKNLRRDWPCRAN